MIRFCAHGTGYPGLKCAGWPSMGVPGIAACALAGEALVASTVMMLVLCSGIAFAGRRAARGCSGLVVPIPGFSAAAPNSSVADRRRGRASRSVLLSGGCAGAVRSAVGGGAQVGVAGRGVPRQNCRLRGRTLPSRDLEQSPNSDQLAEREN